MKTVREIEKEVSAVVLAAGQHGVNRCISEGISVNSPDGIRRIYAEMEWARREQERKETHRLFVAAKESAARLS